MQFDDNTEYISNEMLLFAPFYRNLVLRRVGDFTRLWDKSQLTEYPKGSFLHLIDDNFSMNKPIVLVPNNTSWSMSLLPSKKYVMHITEQVPSYGITPTESFVLPTKGVTTTIINFKKRNQMTMRPVNTFQDFPNDTRTNVQAIVSYNSLYRARIFGLMRSHRRFLYIWTNLLNMIIALPPNRQHFIPIPVGNRQYTIDKFRTTFVKYTKGSIKSPDDYWYLFMMHLLGFMYPEKTESIFEQVPKQLWKDIYFVLYAGSKMIIVNLENLKTFNESNVIMIRFIKQLNALAEYGTIVPTVDYADVEPIVDTVEDTTELVVDATTPFDDEGKVNATAFKVAAIPTAKVTTATTKDDIVVEDDALQPVVQKEPTTSTKTINPKISSAATKLRIESAVNEFSKFNEFEPLRIDPKLLELDLKENENNSPRFKEASTKQEQKIFAKEMITDTDARAKEKIENAVNLTSSQVKRNEQLATAYKTIKIGDSTIESLISVPPEDTVATNSLTFLENDDDIVDKSMLHSSVNTFDHDYITKMFDRDLAMVISSFNTQGMFLKEFKREDVSDSLNNVEELRMKYEDINHKEHNLRFTIPKVDTRGFCMINGSLKVLKKQRVPNPICKISPTTVTLNSDYNKYLVERNVAVAHSFTSYVERILAKADKQSTVVMVTLGSSNIKNKSLPYEYTALSKKYQDFSFGTANRKYTISLDYTERFNLVSDFNKEYMESAVAIEEENPGYVLAIRGPGTQVGYMSLDGALHLYDFSTEHNLEPTTLIDLLCEVLSVGINNLSEWIDFKLQFKSIPIVFALCYRYGLTHMLDYLHTEYKLYDARQRFPKKWSDVIIKFADKTLVIPRAPLINSLIFAGLNSYDLSSVVLEEMDSKDIYYDLIQSKKMSVHNLKGIDSFFDLFMDPITKDVLHQMKEPTNTKDLLIRAVQLLSTEDHLPSSSSVNHRFRSYERINSAIYKTLSRSFATYKNKSLGATNKWSIADYEVQKLILEDQLMESVDMINPINDIKYQEEFSHAGFGGRKSADTFMVTDRQFTDDDTGIVSEATIDSSKTAFAASTSVDPTIVNMRGMTISVPPEQLEPTQILSVAACLVPGITQDDGKRL